MSTIAGVVATVMTGRDLGEHALSLALGEDCRFLESLLRDGRGFCEPHGSPQTANDFKGIIALLNDDDDADAGVQVASNETEIVDTDAGLVDFEPIDRRLHWRGDLIEEAEEVEIVEEEAAGAEAQESSQLISFGFMSGGMSLYGALDVPRHRAADLESRRTIGSPTPPLARQRVRDVPAGQVGIEERPVEHGTSGRTVYLDLRP